MSGADASRHAAGTLPERKGWGGISTAGERGITVAVRNAEIGDFDWRRQCCSLVGRFKGEARDVVVRWAVHAM